MKKLIILPFLLMALNSHAITTLTDSISVDSLVAWSITDTIYVIDKAYINFGGDWSIEVEYSELDADDATLDLGTTLDVTDSCFNSYGHILGISFPVTLNVTSDTDDVYGKASFLAEHPDRMMGTKLLIKVSINSCTTGWIRYKIIATK